MDLTIFIGIFVIVFSVALVVVVYLIVKKMLGLKSSKQISIYVDERKENVSPSKILNTPFDVDGRGKLKISNSK